MLAGTISSYAQCVMCGDPACNDCPPLNRIFNRGHRPLIQRPTSPYRTPRNVIPRRGAPAQQWAPVEQWPYEAHDQATTPYYGQGVPASPSDQSFGPGSIEQIPPGTIDGIPPAVTPPTTAPPTTSPDGVSSTPAPQTSTAPPNGFNNFNNLALAGTGRSTGFAEEALPNVMGDFLGGGFASVSLIQTEVFRGHLPGTVISGTPGSSGSSLVFESTTPATPDDIYTTGAGSDQAGTEGYADTYDLAEPVAPSDLPTNPGTGYVYDGGTAVYTGNSTSQTAQPGTYTDGDLWYISYSFSNSSTNGNGTRLIAGPGTASRRIKIAESFNPDVRDRIFINYSFFNDAIGGLGDISRWVVGAEHTLGHDNFSIEARVPIAATLGSSQDVLSEEVRDVEFGNATIIGKLVLARSSNVVWSTGLGVTVPTADDTRLTRGNLNLIVVENQSINYLPFTALSLRLTEDTFFQTHAQLDINTRGNPVYGDSDGGIFLPKIGTFEDSTLLNLDFSLSHRLYQRRARRRGSERCLSSLFATSELHYSSTLDDANVVSGNGITFSSFAPDLDVLNATFGGQFLFANGMLVTPGVSVPLRDGVDRQFDYEAMLQVNFLF
ncbi:MAG: hypothetical protein HKN47_29110 [Pirellulaceae bacterium]|nr:hypothetical protein [Pirellulaceae bacterium]